MAKSKKLFQEDSKTCQHPEDLRMKILSGPGSYVCFNCGITYITLPKPEFIHPTEDEWNEFKEWQEKSTK